MRAFCQLVTLLVCVGVTFTAAWSAESQSIAELRPAQAAGWDTAAVLAQGLATSDPKRFPGLHAWLRDYRAIGGVPGKRLGTAAVPKFDVERLVTRNSSFWRAYFEMAPGDPGAMLMHAGLLLAAGEASRCAYMLIIARQTPEIRKEMLQALDNLLQHAQGVILRGSQQVGEAAKHHDAGQVVQATLQLRASVSAWPGNALAHYELALAMLAQQYLDAGRQAPPRTRLSIHSELAPAAPALAAYARARLHDPLLIRAYRGDDKAGASALLALGKTVRPLWDMVARDTQAETRDETLGDLAEAFQDIGAHDLALALGQVVFGREGGYDDDDRKFIAESLRALAPAVVDPVLKRVGSQRPEFARIVLP